VAGVTGVATPIWSLEAIALNIRNEEATRWAAEAAALAGGGNQNDLGQSSTHSAPIALLTALLVLRFCFRFKEV